MTPYRGRSKVGWPSRTLMRGDEGITKLLEVVDDLSPSTVEQAWVLIEDYAWRVATIDHLCFVVAKRLQLPEEQVVAVIVDFVEITREYHGQ